VSVVAHVLRADGIVLTRDVDLGDQVANPGAWSVVWEPGDLDVAGVFRVEIQVMWPPDRPQTFGRANFMVHGEIA
jgi:hypothetical protein